MTFYARRQKFNLQNRSAAEVLQVKLLSDGIKRHMGGNTFII